MTVLNTIILDLGFIMILSFTGLIIYFVTHEEKEKPEQKEKKEEREKAYLQLQNMTTDEILLFKDKKEFINSIKQYDTIKYFLNGTEEENTNQLITWYYPGYKKL